MQDGFHLSATWLLGIEGFWSDDPADRGGATKYGISLRFLRSLPDRDHDGFRDGDLDRDGDVDAADIQLLSLSGALDFYRSEFWDACRCDELPAGIDSAVFGGAVNHGTEVATVLMQQALRVKPDGIIGPVTLQAASGTDAYRFMPDYLSHRAQFYADIVASDSSQAKWLRGWFRRLFLLSQFVFTERLPAHPLRAA